ncbi:MAG: transposase [Zoogloeaceae bacterium]|nr:transposase [Zoogloeaceae bacterium]
MAAFLAYYNSRRPHSALGYKPHASRLSGNNLLQHYTYRAHLMPNLLHSRATTRRDHGLS